MGNLDIGDTADVIFFNAETGEEVARKSINAFVEGEINTFVKDEINNSLPSKNNIFGRVAEPIKSTISNPIINDVDFGVPMGSKLITIGMDGKTIAELLEVDKKPKIRRLIFLYNRTKKTRVKSKLNKRIIKEVWR